MWRFIAASTTGGSHLKTNQPCQDWLACEAFENGSLIAVIADGAGSASMARRGAEIVVDTVFAYLKIGLLEKRTEIESILREAADLARKKIKAEADSKTIALQDYASTLLAVILTPNDGGFMQIGDGVIVVSEGIDDWKWVFWPQRGEYANTTYFLTDEGALDNLVIDKIVNPVTDVALMSDGLEHLALNYSDKTVYNPFFKGIFQPLLKTEGSGKISTLSTSLKQFLTSERIQSRTDDDVSLILATCREHQDFQ